MGGPLPFRPLTVRKPPDRHSGRIPALPHPPLEQIESFPFPLSLGSIEGETGNGSLSW